MATPFATGRAGLVNPTWSTATLCAAEWMSHTARAGSSGSTNPLAEVIRPPPAGAELARASSPPISCLFRPYRHVRVPISLRLRTLRALDRAVVVDRPPRHPHVGLDGEGDRRVPRPHRPPHRPSAPDTHPFCPHSAHGQVAVSARRWGRGGRVGAQGWGRRPLPPPPGPGRPRSPRPRASPPPPRAAGRSARLSAHRPADPPWRTCA